MIVSNSGYSATLSQTKSVESSLNAVIDGNNLPVKKTSSDSIQISEAARSKISQEAIELFDLSSESGMYNFGLTVLGESAMQRWSDKGLNISDEAVISAGKAFQDAFNKTIEENGSSAGDSFALNIHQIIINSQEVPGWFTQEHESTISSIENKETKIAFENGEVFFTLKPSSLGAHALASYASLAKNI